MTNTQKEGWEKFADWFDLLADLERLSGAPIDAKGTEERIKVYISSLLQSQREELVEGIGRFLRDAKNPYMFPATEKRFLENIKEALLNQNK